MGPKLVAAIIGAAAVMMAATSAQAADDPGLLALGVGAYDFIGNNDKPSVEFRGEYRAAWGIYFIKPVLGAFVTSDGTYYGYGGLRADIIIAEHYVIMPELAVGYWGRSSNDSKNLGSHVEFKSGGEIAYRFDGGTRLGVEFDHISNAGISKINPGEETVLLVYSLPLSFLP